VADVSEPSMRKAAKEAKAENEEDDHIVTRLSV
jgi:hypothetical protein